MILSKEILSTINVDNLQLAYFENSVLKIHILPFNYNDGRNPRLPRKKSTGYNLLSDTNTYFQTVLKYIKFSTRTDKFRIDIEVTCGNDKLGKADLDNYSKAILDGITKSKKVWNDDKQIDQLHIKRIYSEKSKSCIKIQIKNLK